MFNDIYTIEHYILKNKKNIRIKLLGRRKYK